MKKIFLLLLCVVLSATMLASCGDGEIGDFEYPGYVPDVIPAITLDLYIVVGDGTSDLAIDSVERMVSQYTEQKLNTKLEIHYIEESQYKAELLAGVDKTGKDKADIVLINSYELATQLIEDGKLEDLTGFYDPTDAFIDSFKSVGKNYQIKLFGRLNTMITPSLIEASRVDGKLYTVPNDHVIGEYAYLLINETAATYYNVSPEKLTACTSLDDQVLVDLKAAMEADGKVFSDYVFVANGDYSDKAKYASEGYICNVVGYPTVDADEAFTSAFAVVKGTEYSNRAMEVLYLLNSDAEFRNLLQYGVAGVNYVKDADGNIVPHAEGDGVYNMNALYTGSSFLLYYSADWTEEMKTIGLAQNKESVVYVAPAEPAPEK